MGHILARESLSIPRPEIATLFILGLPGNEACTELVFTLHLSSSPLRLLSYAEYAIKREPICPWGDLHGNSKELEEAMSLLKQGFEVCDDV